MIDPDLITTVRVGELPPSDFNLTDEIPHEVGDELKKGTVQQLADVIGTYLGSIGGLSFNPTNVSDGQTLPTTTGNQWMLVGKGTFPNVGGGATIVTTEELNALTSNGVFWSLSVEIPVNVELAGITQNIRSGYTQTVPSEDKLFNEFALYTKTVDLPNPFSQIPKIEFICDGIANSFDIGVTTRANAVFWNSALLRDADFSQVGSVITLTFIPDLNDVIKPI